MSFNNKVVIVTGAGSGIGAATALLFVKEGANVVIVGRNEDKLKKSANLCAEHGNAPFVIAADVGKDDDAKRIIKETIGKYGKLDILVNNAAIATFVNILDDKVMEVFDQIMAINFRAIVHLTKLAAPYLIESKGNIINVSSVGGKKITPAFPLTIYCSFKAALDHYTRGAALEFAQHGVKVNTVSPGPVLTDILSESVITEFSNATPIKRVMKSKEIGDLILFLCSDKNKGITGSDYVADNGISLT